MSVLYADVILKFRKELEEGGNPSISDYLTQYPQFSVRLHTHLIGVLRTHQHVTSEDETLVIDLMRTHAWSHFQEELVDLFPLEGTKPEPVATDTVSLRVGDLVEMYLEKYPPLNRLREESWGKLRQETESITLSEAPRLLASRFSVRYEESWQDMLVVLNQVFNFARTKDCHIAPDLAFGRSEHQPTTGEVQSFRARVMGGNLTRGD